VASTFTLTNDGAVEVSLSDDRWIDIERALNDCLGSRAPAGTVTKNELSTYWLDQALLRLRRNDGHRVELAAGNMSHLVLEGQVIRVVADYETHDDIEIPAFWLQSLLEQWRSRVIEEASVRTAAYDDDARPGRRTYASLRVFSDELAPPAISHLLDCESTGAYLLGDPVGRSGSQRTANGWFLSSDGSVNSQELGRHINWLLDAVKETQLVALQTERGMQADIFCFFEATQGGPELHPGLLSRLARLGLPLVLGSMHVGESPSETP